MKPMMKCGHAANAQTQDGNPCCAICIMVGNENAHTIAETQPDLTNRQSKCSYCKTTEPSSTDLPFFEHQPNQPKDKHYCGCLGWD